MSGEKKFNHNLSTFGWGALLVWWGISVMIDPITFGICALGTGLILLGINAVRLLKGIPAVGTTTFIGVIALVWGMLDQARMMMALSADLSWALLLVVIGVVIWVELLLPRPQKAE